MISFFTFLTLLFFTHSVHAQEFQAYEHNPIVKKNASHHGATMPFVLKVQDTYSLWYSADSGSDYRIMRMQSSNGLDWYEKKDTNVTSRHNASDPFVTYENNVYTLYFASSNYGPISLWESKSTDGVTFNLNEEKEILKSEVKWEGEHLSCPSVIKDNGLYYLFYSGSGVPFWGIGLATSTDGHTWQKCQNNPFIVSGASEHIVKYSGIYYLFFQSPEGLQVQQTNTLNGCNTLWTNRHIVNIQIWDPAPFIQGDELWLYGASPNNPSIDIMVYGIHQIATPSYPIIVIPGMFASWNGDALLHNSQVSFDSWKMNSSVSEYSSLLQTLQNKGKVLDTDVFLFPYDWRKSITKSAQDLDSYISQKIWSSNKYQPVQLIGHSLGGVVGRTFVDMNPDKPIKQLVTAGSPHLGAVQSYKPLMAGEIDRENTLIWLAEKLILNLNKTLVESDKSTVLRMLPVLSDLVPSFPFLKDESGQAVTSSVQNSLLTSYPIQTIPLIPQFFIGSDAYQMNAGYVLGNRTPTDVLFDVYADGHPISSWKDKGDETTIFKSSLNQASPILQANHGEIIYGKEAIKTILSKLNIPAQDSDIPEGKATSIFPAIFSFIQSPATITIDHAGTSYPEIDGKIHIQQAENGTYDLTVTGQSQGEYTVSIWLIGSGDDKWIQFKKNTILGKKDLYHISFDSTSGGTAQEHVEPTPSPTQTPTQTHTQAVSLTLAPTQVQSAKSSTTPTITPITKNSYIKTDNFTATKAILSVEKNNSNKKEVLGAYSSNTKTTEGKKAHIPYPYFMIIILVLIPLFFVGKKYRSKQKVK